MPNADYVGTGKCNQCRLMSRFILEGHPKISKLTMRVRGIGDTIVLIQGGRTETAKRVPHTVAHVPPSSSSPLGQDRQ